MQSSRHPGDCLRAIPAAVEGFGQAAAFPTSDRAAFLHVKSPSPDTLLKICFAKTHILESSFPNLELDTGLKVKEPRKNLSKKIILIKIETEWNHFLKSRSLDFTLHKCDGSNLSLKASRTKQYWQACGVFPGTDSFA